jgi:putative RecB family exonuclease
MRPVVARPHWSYSSVGQYLRCPLQFYFERVLKLPRKPPSPALLLGSAVHAALAVYHGKLQKTEPVDGEQVRQAFLEAWGVNNASGSAMVPQDRDLGVSLIDVYLQGPPPEGIVAVEEPILAPIADSRGEYLERPILVVPDLITRQDDDSLKITEFKTSGRSFSESEVATSLQPTFYANALHERTGEESAVAYTVLVKTKVPKVQTIEAFRTISDFQRLGDLIGVVEKAVEAEIFYPQESPMNCSSCSYYRECRGWTGPGSPESRELRVIKDEEAAPC